MDTFPILANITVALILALVGGLIVRQIKLPTIVGYMLAGVAMGPFTPGFVGDLHTIQELAELGVIFLLFGVGLHFSLRELWAVRDIAIGGAILQMIIATALVMLITYFWGWSLTTSLVIGLAVSIASTVVLIRNLMDQGLLNTSSGQVAVGWLIMEDLLTVIILVLLPAFASDSGQPLWQSVGLAILKTIAFVALILVGGKRVIPWLLRRIAFLRSQELFTVTVMVITLATAVGAAILFGVSLALGAFLAGVIVHESALSHQVEEEILPFRETFSVLFFVSVGMLVNPTLLVTQFWMVITLTALIVVGKMLIVLFLGLFFKRPAHTILTVAVSLSQIGEFSFLLGQTGMDLNLLSQDEYAILLLGAILSITLNLFLFKLLPSMEKLLQRTGVFWRWLDRHNPEPSALPAMRMQDHVVIIGYEHVSQRITAVLHRLNIPLLIVDNDSARIAALEELQIPVLYGDAANSTILEHASLPQARVVIINLNDEASIETATTTVRQLAPRVPLLVRSVTKRSIKQLRRLGATSVIYPEMEITSEFLNQTLGYFNFPENSIIQFLTTLRQDPAPLSGQSEQIEHAFTQLRETKS